MFLILRWTALIILIGSVFAFFCKCYTSAVGVSNGSNIDVPIFRLRKWETLIKTTLPTGVQPEYLGDISCSHVTAHVKSHELWKNKSGAGCLRTAEPTGETREVKKKLHVHHWQESWWSESGFLCPAVSSLTAAVKETTDDFFYTWEMLLRRFFHILVL